MRKALYPTILVLFLMLCLVSAAFAGPTIDSILKKKNSSSARPPICLLCPSRPRTEALKVWILTSAR